MAIKNIVKRFYPNTSAIADFPYFTMNVFEMKGWQLYVGQTMWLITVGVIFLLINMFLDMTFLRSNEPLRRSIRVAEDISTGEGVSSSYFASQFA